ncbi:EAL domain-containing protein [Massilia niastensis]|uniref:EAL domain-containing protein n=1 Tax=Massilia niastensis TaxID=544911 RepID=UPI000381C1AC|nr:EAL domain-containing protein [Massilia niastensis]
MVTPQEIETALGEHQFCLFYQPKFSLRHPGVEGCEALLRWRHPDGSMVPPGAFIGVAERAGLLPKITSHIVPLLFNDMETLGKTPYCPVSFNATASDFRDDHLVGMILDEIGATGVKPEQLEVEITENEALQSGKQVQENVQHLRDAGLGLAMDDFGTGYSSVDTLSRWPFSTIKIDQGLIGRMLESEKSAHIVRSAIRLAHELDIDLVAEGVEKEAQYHFLLEAGASKVQGYLISRPLGLQDLMGQSQFTGCPVSMAVGTIHMAIMDHIQWRKRMVSFAVRSAMLPPDAPSRMLADHPILSSSKCAIGRWYRGDGQALAYLPDFQRSDGAHERLHAIGAIIVDRVRNGADLSAVMVLLDELQLASIDMLGSLMKLENHALIAIYGPKCMTPVQ